MWHRIKFLWGHNRTALLVFVAVLCLAGFFGVRVASQFIYWADPAHQEQPLAGWMTPRYVSQSYRVPPEVVITAFALDTKDGPRRMSLGTLAAQNGLTMDDLQDRLDDHIATWRAQNPRPRP